jgi:hypothetical protein
MACRAEASAKDREETEELYRKTMARARELAGRAPDSAAANGHTADSAGDGCQEDSATDAARRA